MNGKPRGAGGLRLKSPKLQRSKDFGTPLSALQREEPVDASGRTHGIRHQADARFGHQRWPERQLYEVQLTSGCGSAVTLRQRLLSSRANWRYRPVADTRRVRQAVRNASLTATALD